MIESIPSSEADHEATTVAPSLTDSMSTDTFLSMLDDTVDESSTSLDDYPPVQDDCPVEIPLTTTESVVDCSSSSMQVDDTMNPPELFEGDHSIHPTSNVVKSAETKYCQGFQPSVCGEFFSNFPFELVPKISIVVEGNNFYCCGRR